jgi:hypothetical protein
VTTTEYSHITSKGDQWVYPLITANQEIVLSPREHGRDPGMTVMRAPTKTCPCSDTEQHRVSPDVILPKLSWPRKSQIPHSKRTSVMFSPSLIAQDCRCLNEERHTQCNETPSVLSTSIFRDLGEHQKQQINQAEPNSTRNLEKLNYHWNNSPQDRPRSLY